MAAMRRHWKILCFQLVVFLIFGIYLLSWMQRSVADSPLPTGQTGTAGVGQGGSAVSLDLVTYSRVQRLREQFSLGNQELAAIGCSEATAKAALQRLVDFCKANRSRLDAAEGEEVEAQRLLSDAVRKINVGPNNASTNQLALQLKTLKAQVNAARDAKLALYQQGVESLTTGLSSTQIAKASVLRAKASLPGDFRFIGDLTSAEESEIRKTVAQYGLVSPQLKKLRDRLLVPSRQALLNELIATGNENLAAVSNAERAVLPMPQTLQRPAR